MGVTIIGLLVMVWILSVALSDPAASRERRRRRIEDRPAERPALKALVEAVDEAELIELPQGKSFVSVPEGQIRCVRELSTDMLHWTLEPARTVRFAFEPHSLDRPFPSDGIAYSKDPALDELVTFEGSPAELVTLGPEIRETLKHVIRNYDAALTEGNLAWRTCSDVREVEDAAQTVRGLCRQLFAQTDRPMRAALKEAALSDPVPTVRRSALAHLMSTFPRSKEIDEACESLLADIDIVVRVYAARFLESTRQLTKSGFKDAMDEGALLDALPTSDRYVQLAVIDALEDVGSARSLTALVQTRNRTNDPELLLTLNRAIWAIEDRTSIAPLERGHLSLSQPKPAQGALELKENGELSLTDDAER